AIDKAEEAAELIVSVPIGHRFPPDAPAQMRVRLAWMPKEQRRQELARWRPRAYTKTTIVKKKEAWAEIEATRRRGYSISRAEFSPGVMTLAVPIFDTFGDVQMVLQSPGLIDKVTRDEAKLAAEILRTGERLNAVFGVSSDPPPKLLTRQRAGTGRCGRPPASTSADDSRGHPVRIACSRSPIRSSVLSRPTDRRSRSGVHGEPGPSMLARCSIRLSTPPSEVARFQMRTLAAVATAAASPPFTR